MKRPPQEEARRMKEELYERIEGGTIDMREASRRMRQVLGLSQAAYATRVLKISPRVLIDFERGVGNPTLETLRKIGSPFGLEVGFVRRGKTSEIGGSS
jgi:transcriptional regulator with XRE-family HTH domain